MRTQELHDRFSRLVPERTRNFSVCIAGAGMVGSWTALALARMVGKVDVWDFDEVCAENVGVQAYTSLDIGRLKAGALKDLAFGLPLDTHADYFPAEIPSCDIVVLAVDSIEARREIATRCLEQGVAYMIDSRVLGEIACIHPVMLGGSDGYLSYLASLPEEEDLTHAACGAKGTAFAGMWVASQICAVVNAFGRGPNCPHKVVWHVGMNERIS